MEDVDYLAEFVSENMSVALKVALDWGILYGTATSAQAGLSGIIASSGGFTSATTTVATSVSRADLEGMIGYFYGGGEPVWVFSKVAWNNILTNVDQYISIIDFKSKTLYGIPYIINPSLQGAKAILADFSQYGIIFKHVQQSMDIGLYFQSDQMLFKASVRVAGRAMWSSAITLDDAGVVYPFVATA
jgi:HK97 family phage major capsid protein